MRKAGIMYAYSIIIGFETDYVYRALSVENDIFVMLKHEPFSFFRLGAHHWNFEELPTSSTSHRHVASAAKKTSYS